MSDLARAAGISPRTIERIESGSSEPSALTRRRLDAALSTFNPALGPVMATAVGASAAAYIARLEKLRQGVQEGFANTLRELRLGANLSADELARRSGVSVRTLRRAEAGERISQRSIKAIIRGLGGPETGSADDHQNRAATAQATRASQAQTPLVDHASIRRLSGVVEGLEELSEQLWSAVPRPLVDFEALPREPAVFAISEGSTPIYIGSTRDLREHLRRLTSRGLQGLSVPSPIDLVEDRDAPPFYDQIVGQEMSAAIRSADPRAEAGWSPSEVLERSQQRVGEMTVRYKRAEDRLTRRIFEIYARLALEKVDSSSSS